MENDILITMERQGRDSHFPTYSLTTHGDGRVIYEGIKNVQAIGTRTFNISRPTVDQMVYEFINIYYFALLDRYENRESSSYPIVITSITMEGRTKSVYHEHGSQAPEKLIELEDKIDKLVDSKKWTGVP